MTETTADLEHPDHSHNDVSGGWLRAAVFGAMDGLVSNISLIAGVGGGGVSPDGVLLAGAAGLVAGAISMGIGEYTSVQTQNEQVGHELEKERRELARHPKAEQQELAEMLREAGLSEELAGRVSAEVSKDPELALRVHAQQELGVVVDELPKPWTAAISSFICFSLGAFLPLIPYLLGGSDLWIALVAGAVGLFAAGALVSRFTTRTWWAGGLRQLVLGALAAGATYLVGTVIGVSIT